MNASTPVSPESLTRHRRRERAKPLRRCLLAISLAAWLVAGCLSDLSFPDDEGSALTGQDAGADGVGGRSPGRPGDSTGGDTSPAPKPTGVRPNEGGAGSDPELSTGGAGPSDPEPQAGGATGGGGTPAAGGEQNSAGGAGGQGSGFAGANSGSGGAMSGAGGAMSGVGGAVSGGAGGGPTEPSRSGVLFITGDKPPLAGDRAVLDRLAGLGFNTRVVLDTDLSAGDINAAASAYLSQSAASEAIAGAFRTTPIPVVVNEAYLADDMWMAPLDAPHAYDRAGVWAVVASNHALAAGLPTGDTPVWTAPPLFYGVGVPLRGTVVATEPTGKYATVFAFEKNELMEQGLLAPARRVVFAFDALSPPTFTSAAWALFDATATWALQN